MPAGIDLSCNCDCGDDSVSGSGSVEVVCGDVVVHKPFSKTVTFAGMACIFDCGTANGPFENKSYTLTLDQCNEDLALPGVQCIPCYQLGSLTTSEVLDIYGLTIGIDCEFLESECGTFGYVGQKTCDGYTLDAYLGLYLCFELNPTSSAATIQLSWIYIVTDAGGVGAFYGNGFLSSVAFVSDQCFGSDIIVTCPLDALDNPTAILSFPITGDPSYTGSWNGNGLHAVDCCAVTDHVIVTVT